MPFADIVKRNRSYRRFDQSREVPMAVLEELAGLTRHCASGMNQQPLRYALVADRDKNAEVFPALGWAGYLKDWPGPAEGERPAAYVVVMSVGKSGPWTRADVGIAAQTILLGAAELGLGGCMIATVNRDVVARALDLPQDCEIQLVLALGAPAETVVVDDQEPDGDCKYWRDDQGVHHVPKLRTADVVVRRFPSGV